MCILPDGTLHDVLMEDNGDLVLRLRSIDQARRAWRRCALRYAVRKLRELGYDGAALALECAADKIPTRSPDPLNEF